jgi:hypothetical protein
MHIRWYVSRSSTKFMSSSIDPTREARNMTRGKIWFAWNGSSKWTNTDTKKPYRFDGGCPTSGDWTPQRRSLARGRLGGWWWQRWVLLQFSGLAKWTKVSLSSRLCHVRQRWSRCHPREGLEMSLAPVAAEVDRWRAAQSTTQIWCLTMSRR